MYPDSHTPAAEVEAHRHPIFPDSERYEIVRYVYDFDREANHSVITLTFLSEQTKQRKCLRFSGVRCDHPLSGYFGLYILDTKYRQWQADVRIEVGEYYEEGGVYFYAASVEEVVEAAQEGDKG